MKIKPLLSSLYPVFIIQITEFIAVFIIRNRGISKENF
jgi:hypothetical protein